MWIICKMKFPFADRLLCKNCQQCCPATDSQVLFVSEFFLLFLSVQEYKCCLIVCKLVLFFYCFYPYQVIFAAGCDLHAAHFSCSVSSFVGFVYFFLFFSFLIPIRWFLQLDGSCLPRSSAAASLQLVRAQSRDQSSGRLATGRVGRCKIVSYLQKETKQLSGSIWT